MWRPGCSPLRPGGSRVYYKPVAQGFANGWASSLESTPNHKQIYPSTGPTLRRDCKLLRAALNSRTGNPCTLDRPVLPQVLVDDFHRSKDIMLFLLKAKTSYLGMLPWVFCALAHTGETVARSFAIRAKEAWSLDPRPEAHHRVTVDLMRPGGDFEKGLDRFVDGAPRSELGDGFLSRVAAFRFIPVVETTIEAKHARTSLCRRVHHIGPVRISLANRLPYLERSIRLGHISPLALLEQFQRARTFKALPGGSRMCLLGDEGRAVGLKGVWSGTRVGTWGRGSGRLFGRPGPHRGDVSRSTCSTSVKSEFRFPRDSQSAPRGTLCTPQLAGIVLQFVARRRAMLLAGSSLLRRPCRSGGGGWRRLPAPLVSPLALCPLRDAGWD